VTNALTNARTVAASLPTTSLMVAVEKWAPTSTDWAVAVIPMIARNAPNTMPRRTGRGAWVREPNTI
jgi:hypothetical protein